MTGKYRFPFEFVPLQSDSLFVSMQSDSLFVSMSPLHARRLTETYKIFSMQKNKTGGKMNDITDVFSQTVCARFVQAQSVKHKTGGKMNGITAVFSQTVCARFVQAQSV
jgi:hypothetical protein